MKYLIDSNVMIALVANSNPGVVERAGECYEGEIVTSAIAYAEVLFGAARGKPPGIARLSVFVHEVPILPFDQLVAQAYAKLPFRRSSYDQLIAAHAIAYGLVLVTHNQRHFTGIDGLAVENWFSPADGLR